MQQQQKYSSIEQPALPTITPAEFTAQKRAYIRERLDSHYPFLVTIIYAILISLIGITEIALQSVLISNKAINWQIGNGIWGGLACIFAGLLNLNLMRKRTYWKYFGTLLTTGLFAIVFAVAFISIPAIALKQYSLCDQIQPAQCNDPQSQAITTAMLGVGIGSVAVNTIYIIAFQVVLLGGCQPILLYGSGLP